MWNFAHAAERLLLLNKFNQKRPLKGWLKFNFFAASISQKPIKLLTLRDKKNKRYARNIPLSGRPAYNITFCKTTQQHKEKTHFQNIRIVCGFIITIILIQSFFIQSDFRNTRFTIKCRVTCISNLSTIAYTISRQTILMVCMNKLVNLPDDGSSWTVLRRWAIRQKKQSLWIHRQCQIP